MNVLCSSTGTSSITSPSWTSGTSSTSTSRVSSRGSTASRTSITSTPSPSAWWDSEADCDDVFLFVVLSEPVSVILTWSSPYCAAAVQDASRWVPQPDQETGDSLPRVLADEQRFGDVRGGREEYNPGTLWEGSGPLWNAGHPAACLQWVQN